MKNESGRGRPAQWHWLVTFGTGWAHYALEGRGGAPDLPSADAWFATAGFGQRWHLDRRARLRWELSVDRTLHISRYDVDLTTIRLMLHLSWAIKYR